LNGRNIPFVNHVKYFGVIFDKRITWGYIIKKNSGASVCQRTIPTERQTLVGEVSANV
jgi:hypothetical protein